MLIEVRHTDKYGRGLYATKDMPANLLLDACEILVLSPSDTLKVNETDLACYTFVYDLDTKQDCLVLGDGELYNHDEEPNVYYRLISIGNRKVMQFLTNKPVKAGDQLFIDYSQDTKSKASYDKNLT